MESYRITPGRRLTAPDGVAGTVTRADRSPWRRRLRRFRVLWDGAARDAQYLAGDEDYFGYP